MERVSVVGSTGSIGRQTLEVIRETEDRFGVSALAAGRSGKLLAEQAEEFEPTLVVLVDPEGTDLDEFRKTLPRKTELMVGRESLVAAAQVGEIVVNAVVGFAGLPVTLEALKGGRRLALANKESLIAGGPVVGAVRGTEGAELVPVDSEHGAIHQCLGSAPREAVAKLWVTASGGPFRGRRRGELEAVTLEEALKHPTWSMGPKITVDSSTLMNKGLEVIEAHELFGIDYERIGVVVHPESVVHSMVEWRDGSTLAQLSAPDMRLAIGYALGWPERLTTAFGALDWGTPRTLHFEEPDGEAFGCLGLAYAAGKAGGSAPACLSAANEVAVAAFLEGRLRWLAIENVVGDVLNSHEVTALDSVTDVLAVDAEARRRAASAVVRLGEAA